MRSADTYRGARRNAARADRKAARKELRDGELIRWRRSGLPARANLHADLPGRAAMANAAREAAAKAIVENRTAPPQSVATAALLDFYRTQPRSRVVSRILRDLERAKRAA